MGALFAARDVMDAVTNDPTFKERTGEVSVRVDVPVDHDLCVGIVQAFQSSGLWREGMAVEKGQSRKGYAVRVRWVLR